VAKISAPANPAFAFSVFRQRNPGRPLNFQSQLVRRTRWSLMRRRVGPSSPADGGLSARPFDRFHCLVSSQSNEKQISPHRLPAVHVSIAFPTPIYLIERSKHYAKGKSRESSIIRRFVMPWGQVKTRQDGLSQVRILPHLCVRRQTVAYMSKITCCMSATWFAWG
jgi:hypothetical protein